ncbi:GtrA family protein [candidate division WOR-3 bacterium]|nr:GtrA family protein [candidate division WOR-3 bacterium]
MKKNTGLAIKYTLFAAAATALNIMVQRVVFIFNPSIWVAMAAGTTAGLMLKYILDKKYIFYYRTKSFSHDIRKFILYSFLGGLTTLLFWSVELFFEYCVSITASKYIGALVGLSAGYTIKYFLDKKFVFLD